MNLRSREIYVSSKTKRRLYWIRDLKNQELPDTHETGAHFKTLSVDEIADRMLNEIIEIRFPNITVLEKRRDALEGQLISELRNPTVKL